MTLILLRHPPIDHQGRVIGQLDLPVYGDLNRWVRRVVAAIKQPMQIISSDLQRCAQLAQGLRDYWGGSLILDPQLRECSMGLWEGRTYDDLAESGDPQWFDWCDHWQQATPPQGESLIEFSHRIEQWSQAWFGAKHLNGDQDKQSQTTRFESDNSDPHLVDPATLVVTHAGVIRAFWVQQGLSWEAAMQRPVAHCKPYFTFENEFEGLL